MIYLKEIRYLEQIQDKEKLGLVRSLNESLFNSFIQICKDKNYIEAKTLRDGLGNKKSYSQYQQLYQVFCSIYEKQYSETIDICKKIRRKIFQKKNINRKLLNQIMLLLDQFDEEQIEFEKIIFDLVKNIYFDEAVNIQKIEKIRDLLIYFHRDQIALELIGIYLYESQDLLLSIDLFEYIKQRFRTIKLDRLLQIAYQEKWIVKKRKNDKVSDLTQVIKLDKVEEDRSYNVKKINLEKFIDSNDTLENLYRELELKNFIYSNPFKSRSKMIDYLILGNHIDELFKYVEKDDEIQDLFNVITFFINSNEETKAHEIILNKLDNNNLKGHEKIELDEIKSKIHRRKS